jgi:Tfp pilus assembly protein PilX
MRRWRRLVGNQHGVAMVLAVLMVLVLTGLLMAFLSVSAFEPQISRNLADTARARYLAEAGIEVGFNLLVGTSDAANSFTPALAGATATTPWVTLVNAGTLSGVTAGGAAAEGTFAGTYTVTVRNDYQNGDNALTGQAAGTNAAPNETLTTDANKMVIMRSTGSFRGATKTIEVVVRRGNLPPFPGAVNLPGVQSDTYINKSSFDIDGRDYRCASSCDTNSNWTLSNTNNKYGIATQPGYQSNLASTTYEQNVQNAMTTASKQASVHGRDQTSAGSPPSTTNGLNTVAADASLNPTNIQAYLDAVRNYSGTTVLQSTQACPMQLTGTSTPTNTPTLTNGCSGANGVNQALDLGTRANPKLVYFKGDIDTSSAFTGLQMNSGIKGAGILVVEDGDLKNFGNLTWDGVVIVTGHYIGAGFMSGSDTLIRGALVANEKEPGEASGFFEFYLDGNANSLSVHQSKQNIDMIQLIKGNHTITNWREL